MAKGLTAAGAIALGLPTAGESGSNFNAGKFVQGAATKYSFDPNALEGSTPLGAGSYHTVLQKDGYALKPFHNENSYYGNDFNLALPLANYASATGVGPPSQVPIVAQDGVTYARSQLIPHKVQTRDDGTVRKGDVDYDKVHKLIDRVYASGVNFLLDAIEIIPGQNEESIYLILNDGNVRCTDDMCYIIDVDGASMNLRMNKGEFIREIQKIYPRAYSDLFSDKFVGPGFVIDFSEGGIDKELNLASIDLTLPTNAALTKSRVERAKRDAEQAKRDAERKAEGDRMDALEHLKRPDVLEYFKNMLKEKHPDRSPDIDVMDGGKIYAMLAEDNIRENQPQRAGGGDGIPVKKVTITNPAELDWDVYLKALQLLSPKPTP